MSEKNNSTPSYGFYSKLLNKPFDTIEELKAAEKTELDLRAEKEIKAEARKSEAKKVEDAFKAYNAAKTEYNTTLAEARKVAAKIIADAKAAYAKSVQEATNKLRVSEEAYDKALREFKLAHPDGYHLTLRDGDDVTDIDWRINSDLSSLISDFYTSMLKLF